ncbi:MAG: hypothetical protein DI556_09945 [Rhodovulum sulfidophilum]|uniref:Uncharacterized protein n=1 Tax=Rhodovulum sulfidophilum TaxID=35806 RepID=A0A2W5Q4Z7_RHOSU|nr:MAG: hypothetical protein DI556_09945 [Rhodovulum sulfidophilum]
MIKLVSERSERDIAIAELRYALVELAAQTMRIAAGGGSVTRWGHAFDKVNDFFERKVDGKQLGITLFEMQTALQFERLGPGVVDQTDREIDAIARHALRLVASRLESNNTQVSRSESDLDAAIRRLEQLREERRREHRTALRQASSQRAKGKALAAASLSEPMIDALRFLSEANPNPLDGKLTPGAATLRALEARGLIERGEGRMGYSLTPRGEKARRGR